MLRPAASLNFWRINPDSIGDSLTASDSTASRALEGTSPDPVGQLPHFSRLLERIRPLTRTHRHQVIPIPHHNRSGSRRRSLSPFPELLL